MTDQVVFEQTVDGLFIKALGGRIDATLEGQLREAGLDVARPLRPVYPFEIWMEAIRLAAAGLFPQLTAEEAQFRLGVAFVDGYRATFLGRLVVGLARLQGPHEALLHAAEAFRSGNNYTEARVSVCGPTCLQLWLNEVGPCPGFTAGIIHGVLSATGVTPKVALRDWDGHACTYAISWSPRQAGSAQP